MSQAPAPASPAAPASDAATLESAIGNAALFPVLEHHTFLNHAAVAPLSGPAAQAIAGFAQRSAAHGYLETDVYRRLNDMRSAAARLIHARGPQEIAFIPNTSTGIATVAEGIDWRPGDQVVITNVEYPANRYPWQHLRRRGVELIEVPQEPDLRIDAEAVCDAVTNRTRVVAISHVQFASGFRIDLQPIAAMVHRVGGYLFVDGIQSVGLLPVDVQSMGIDFLAADGHKWMLGPEGAGFLYVHEDLIRLLTPPVVGWLNMKDAHDYSNYRFEFQDTAQRFEPGSWNVPGLLGLDASLRLLLEVGVDRIWSRVEATTSRLTEGLREAGYVVRSPRTRPGERSGNLVFDTGEDGFSADRLAAELGRHGIVAAVRGGRVRFSPHFYLPDEQIERCIDLLQTLR